MSEIEAIKQLRKNAAALNTVIEAVHVLTDIVQELEAGVAALSRPRGEE